MQEEAGSVSEVTESENLEKNKESAAENTAVEEKSEKQVSENETEQETADDDSYEEESETELLREEQTELDIRRENMTLDGETALLETVLFLESEPQNVDSLSRITKLSPDVIKECLENLKAKYSAPDSGIELSQIIGGWILTPKKECFDFVKERYGKKNDGKLSKAAVETLSIIAYSQPITRAEIESIRHVSVDNMMRILLERNFIKEVGKKDIPGKPTLYGTTKEFLEFFHLQSISELPQLDEKENERFIELAR
ncbi:segregation and condensation protein B [Treponema rectale]|uniref:Segregation and condensation protein B n=2 Tax=Treponemataceae TaxID=2845253 RepID=A0A840S6C6_9SPIR|nr:segregation and condensation protein B [Treponema rectale]